MHVFKMNLLIVLQLLFWAINLSAQNKMYVAFCAKEGIPGHAFVSLGREDEESKMTIHDGTWGLYPKNKLDGGKSFIIGEVPGEIRDDLLTGSDYTYVIEASQKDYDEVLKIVKKWREGSNYELLEKDCVSFLIEVAKIFKRKMAIPPREGFDNLPNEYVKKIKFLNSK